MFLRSKLTVLLILLIGILGISLKAQEKYQYDLAVCAVFKNETRFMREWLEFYKIIGVQHFYLYNNNSTDNYMEILDPYIKRKEVEIFNWKKPLEISQSQLYDDVIQKTTGIVKWLVIVDFDEFLFPMQTDKLLDFLDDYESFGGVCVNWVMYGTSDKEYISDNELMIEELIMCNKHYISDFCVKSIVRPERVDHMSVHYAFYKDGFYQVNSDKVRFEGAWAPTILIDKIRINHYYTRDIKNLLEVKIPLRMTRRIKPYEYKKKLELMEVTLKAGCDYSIEEDRSIFKYIPMLKNNMQK